MLLLDLSDIGSIQGVFYLLEHQARAIRIMHQSVCIHTCPSYPD